MKPVEMCTRPRKWRLQNWNHREPWTEATQFPINLSFQSHRCKLFKPPNPYLIQEMYTLPSYFASCKYNCGVCFWGIEQYCKCG